MKNSELYKTNIEKITDEASLYLINNKKIKFILGDKNNFKITTIDDLKYLKSDLVTPLHPINLCTFNAIFINSSYFFLFKSTGMMCLVFAFGLYLA